MDKEVVCPGLTGLDDKSRDGQKKSGWTKKVGMDKKSRDGQKKSGWTKKVGMDKQSARGWICAYTTGCAALHNTAQSSPAFYAMR
jgi:hypothetical protein